jgi:hypothetical protein
VNDCLIWCGLTLVLGCGIGGALMNEVVWRKQRRELALMRRDLDESQRRWDAEIAESLEQLKEATP